MSKNAQGFQTYYPSSANSTGLPVYSQQSQTTAAPANVETFDSELGYVRPPQTNNVTDQKLPRGAKNGVPVTTHAPGDPNL